MMNSKNHTISKIVAKTFLKLLITTLALSLFFIFNAKDLNNTIYFSEAWLMIFPLLLFTIVFILLIIVLKNKYALAEMNWLFSLSTAFFCIYVILLYAKMYPIL